MDLTPPEMARANGFFDLGEILKTHHHSPSNFSHIYDYIKHGRIESPKDASTLRSHPNGQTVRPTSGTSEMSDYSGPDPYLRAESDSVYKVPPPPRPLPVTPPRQRQGGAPGNYLDMSRSNSGTPSGSPSLQHRMTHNARSQQSEVVALLQQLQLRREVETMSKYNLDSSYSQAKARAGLEDPFGTLRGSKARRSLREKTSNFGANSCKPKVMQHTFPIFLFIYASLTMIPTKLLF